MSCLRSKTKRKFIIAYISSFSLKNINTYLYFQETLVKNPISDAEEPDFFADMQPVIQAKQVMTPHDKFAPILQGNLLKGIDNKTVTRLSHLFSSQ